MEPPISSPSPFRSQADAEEPIRRRALRRRAPRAARREPGRRADGHRTTRAAGARSLPRVADNARVLLASYRAIAAAIREERAITPAAEWLVDNFHIVEEQIREIREDLPPRLLPRAAEARRRARSRAIRASSASPGRSSPTPTAASIPRRCGASSRLPARRAADDRRAVGGGDHACASCWSRTCGGSPSASCAAASPRQRGGRARGRLLGLGDGRPRRRPRLRRIDAAALPTRLRGPARPAPARPGPDASRPALRWLEQRLAPQGTTPRRSCAPSTRARRARTSRCATSSPACA